MSLDGQIITLLVCALVSSVGIGGYALGKLAGRR